MIPEIIGTTGMLALLTAFFLEDKGIFKKHSKWFNGLNLFGALSLIYYAYTLNGYIFVILNIVWAMVAFYYLIKK